MFAWLRDGHSYYDGSLTCPRGGFDCDKDVLMTLGQGAIYLGVLLLIVVLLSMAFFRRRDIP